MSGWRSFPFCRRSEGGRVFLKVFRLRLRTESALMEINIVLMMIDISLLSSFVLKAPSNQLDSQLVVGWKKEETFMD